VTGDREPDWLGAVKTCVSQSRSEEPEPHSIGTLRPAAVLVLLVDSEQGPNILLTKRATALANYPGILVFPGGSAQTGDDGSVATALREASACRYTIDGTAVGDMTSIVIDVLLGRDR